MNKGMTKYLYELSSLKYQLATLFCCTILLLSSAAYAQETLVYKQPDKNFKDAQYYFQERKYAVAMQLFQKTINNIDYFQETNRQLVLQDATYYYAICALKLNNDDGEALAKDFIAHYKNAPRKQLASYYLANYYFQKNQLQEAIPYYEEAGIDNLSNEQIANAKFQLAYCYFNVKEFDKAQPLFSEIKDIPDGKYYIPANYYYGFIAFYNKDYNQALRSFQRVANQEKYNRVVPYYLAQIYYYQGDLDKMLAYSEPLLQSGKLYYDAELRHLVGQAYFEKKDYAKALPYLEKYYENSDKVTKEDVYELSYCYYKMNDLQKAIKGFKQLTGATDSLGQNSMYILGDCYLKTGQKANARNAFAFCARNNYNPKQQEISRFNYGKLSYELGYQDAAITTLQNFDKDYPQSAYSQQARQLLGQLFMNTNDYKNAYAVISSIQDKTPQVRTAYQKVSYGRAMQLVNDGVLDSAKVLLNVSLQNPTDRQLQQLAYFWQGEIDMRNKNYDKAINDINQYFSLGQINSPAASGEANEQTAHYNLGYCYLQKGNYPHALSNFQAAQSIYGPHGESIAEDAKLRSADCYYVMRDYNNALNLYNQIVNNNAPGAAYALYQKSIIAGINGNYQQKISLLQQLSSKYPHSNFDNDAGYEIASTYMANENYREAIPYLKNIINNPNNPDAPKAMLKLGLAYNNLNDNDNAITYYKRVVQQYSNSQEASDALQSLRNLYINNNNPNAYVSFLKSTGRNVSAAVGDSVTYSAAEADFGNGNYSAALSALNNYLSKYPQGQFVLPANFYKAESLFHQKDYLNALTAYEYVLSQGNTRFAERASAQAAQINFYQVKNYTKAKLDYQQLRDLSTNKDNSMIALRGLLQSNYQLQSWEDVVSDAKELLSNTAISTDDQITAHFYLGQAYKAQQNCDEAINEFKAVSSLTKSEQGAEARYNIAECYFNQNKLKTAESAANDVIKNTPSYDYWIAKSYILLGSIFAAEKDYFNAKATLQSIVDNAKIPELVNIARTKLKQVEAEEKSTSKIVSDTTGNHFVTDTTGMQNNQ